MIRVLGMLSAATLVLGACGGGATTAPASAPAGGGTAAAADSAVTVESFKFGPQSVEVKVGSKVTWTNKDGAAHTTTSGTPAAKDGKWDGQLPASGGTFSMTFAQAGSFSYFCSIHNAMTGTVVVK